MDWPLIQDREEVCVDVSAVEYMGFFAVQRLLTRVWVCGRPMHGQESVDTICAIFFGSPTSCRLYVYIVLRTMKNNSN